MIIHHDYPCTSCKHYSPYDEDYNHWVCDCDHHTCPHIEELHNAVGYKKQIDAEVLDKIRAEIKQAANKQFQIAMGVADLNERYTHIQMENAYRHSINIIDKYKAESEG